MTIKEECPECSGTGHLYGTSLNHACFKCYGTGKISKIEYDIMPNCKIVVESIKPITREHILATQLTHIYVYGHDLKRLGKEGWAGVCAGCPNAFPITTKFLPCKDSAAYFSDYLIESVISLINRDIDHIETDKSDRLLVILPKLGNDESEMEVRAPKCYDYLMDTMGYLCSAYQIA